MNYQITADDVAQVGLPVSNEFENLDNPDDSVVSDGSDIDVLPVNEALADTEIAGSHGSSSDQMKMEDDADDDLDFGTELLLIGEGNKAGGETGNETDDDSDEGEYDEGIYSARGNFLYRQQSLQAMVTNSRSKELIPITHWSFSPMALAAIVAGNGDQFAEQGTDSEYALVFQPNGTGNFHLPLMINVMY
ncbi:unnamed protein product [Gongylonema pulchrum]|uniref:Mcl1_mid domain-containing protein n=1 Tax=Gongylonema pulchrum TaxID=637853 RepID=A0A183DW23_9BILA|nr:unnamed protein product [Gongylonema pulchrum]